MKSRWFRGRTVWGVVGIVVAAVAASGALADPGEKDQGYLGVYMQELTRDMRDGLELDVEKGVLISGVEEGSPAEAGGLEDGDVVVEFNGKAVGSPDELRDMVGATKPGDKVDVVVIRDGERKTVAVTVGERPEGFAFQRHGDGDDDGDFEGFRWFGDGTPHSMAAFFAGPRLGVQATELNDDLASYFDAKAGAGVLVTGVEDESVAAKAGVKAGDVIQKVGDASISTVDDLRKSLKDFKEGDEFDVSVLRKGKKQALKATMDDQPHLSMWSGDDALLRMQELKKHPGVKGLREDPRLRVRIEKDELDDALDELRDEIKELKKEIEELKKEG